jgi:hypothetical protein
MSKIQKIKTLLLLLANRLRIPNLRIGFCGLFELGIKNLSKSLVRN